MQNETLKNNLILIKNNLIILKIKNMSLNNSMQIVESAIEKLKPVSGPIRDVKMKIHAVTEKNSRLY
jgi:hypothetical protein